MRCDKLVRDMIPQIIEESGNEAVTRILEDEEYVKALKEKLQEEVQEYLESDDPEELADIIQIIRALVDYHSMSYSDLESVRERKLHERGGFESRIYLEEVIEN